MINENSQCVHCGGYSSGYTEEEFYKHHGRGRCVPGCEHCRRGIPHAKYTCGWDENKWGPSPNQAPLEWRPKDI